MPRKLAAVMLLLVAALSFWGCSGATERQANTIGPKTLAQEQKDLVGLLSDSQQEILLFSYAADAQYKDIDVWVEIYRDGVLIEPRAGGIHQISDIEQPHTGEMAVIITQTPDFQWKFALSEGSGKVSSMSDPSPHYLSSTRGYGPVTQPVAIEDGKEIVLYVSVFTDENSIHTLDEQAFVNQPELLKQYAYAHIIKCKFSK